MIAAIGLGFLIYALVRHRRALRLARLLLGSGYFEATVEAPEVALQKTVEYIRKWKSSTRQVTTKGGGTTTETSTSTWMDGHAKSSGFRGMRLRTPDGAIEVTGDRALWGAPLEYHRVEGGHSKRAETRAAVNAGDQVIVLGRIIDENGVPTIQATGLESLVLFAAREHPRATLRQLTLGWLLNAFMLLAVIAGSVTLALYMWMHARP